MCPSPRLSDRQLKAVKPKDKNYLCAKTQRAGDLATISPGPESSIFKLMHRFSGQLGQDYSETSKTAFCFNMANNLSAATDSCRPARTIRCASALSNTSLRVLSATSVPSAISLATACEDRKVTPRWAFT